MSWLRIDDGFTENHKIASLNDREFRTWLRVLCYAGRRDTGRLTKGMVKEIPGLTPTTLKRFENLGLFDRISPETIDIHDWLIYSDRSLAVKVNYYLERHPNATANDVVKALHAKRELVLAAVREYHEGTTLSGSANGSRELPAAGSPAGTRAPASRPLTDPITTEGSSESENQKGEVLQTEARHAQPPPETNTPTEDNWWIRASS